VPPLWAVAIRAGPTVPLMSTRYVNVTGGQKWTVGSRGRRRRGSSAVAPAQSPNWKKLLWVDHVICHLFVQPPLGLKSTPFFRLPLFFHFGGDLMIEINTLSLFLGEVLVTYKYFMATAMFLNMFLFQENKIEDRK